MHSLSPGEKKIVTITHSLKWNGTVGAESTDLESKNDLQRAMVP